MPINQRSHRAVKKSKDCLTHFEVRSGLKFQLFHSNGLVSYISFGLIWPVIIYIPGAQAHGTNRTAVTAILNASRGRYMRRAVSRYCQSPAGLTRQSPRLLRNRWGRKFILQMRFTAWICFGSDLERNTHAFKCDPVSRSGKVSGLEMDGEEILVA